jgi:hypothetical protein
MMQLVLTLGAYALLALAMIALFGGLEGIGVRRLGLHCREG